MGLRDLIDDGVLADARKIDGFLRDHGEPLPSLEDTLRLIRDIDSDHLRRVGKDVWGTGGEDGRNLVGAHFDDGIEGLDLANRQTSAWTGDAHNAYATRIDKIKGGINDMRRPAADVGDALVAIADAWDQVFGRSFADILAIIGLILSIIGVIVALVVEVLAGWTGIGAVVGLVIGVLAIIVGAVSIWWTIHSQEQSKIDALEAAGVEATETMTSANQTTL
jgi:hypothetical protein